jgi:hypothetical protein
MVKNGDRPLVSADVDPVRLVRSGGFGATELHRVERLVIAQQELLLGAWNEYFGSTE